MSIADTQFFRKSKKHGATATIALLVVQAALEHWNSTNHTAELWKRIAAQQSQIDKLTQQAQDDQAWNQSYSQWLNHLQSGDRMPLPPPTFPTNFYANEYTNLTHL